jgi:ABC-2 type transport system permease protein
VSKLARQYRSEIRKIRTTAYVRAFVILFLIGIAVSAIATFYNSRAMLTDLEIARHVGPSDAGWQQIMEEYGPVRQTSNVLVTGQSVGLLVTLLVSVFIVTEEFQFRTASATYLYMPDRRSVFAAKVLASLVVTGLLWALALVAGSIVLYALSLQVGTDFLSAGPQVVRAVLLNLLAYGLWAAMGIGLGFIVRSRVVGVLVGLAVFALNTEFMFGVVNTFEYLIYGLDSNSWMTTAIVGLPRTSTEAMTTTLSKYQGTPQHWWAGALILTAYTAAVMAIGYRFSVRRDVVR